MKHKDGYCDLCGCELHEDAAQLTWDGGVVCDTCVERNSALVAARRPWARDDDE